MNKSNSILPKPTNLNGKWRMISVTNNISGIATSKPSTIQGEVDILFESTNNTVGTFKGNTPTNIIAKSDYSIGANNSLTIHNLVITK